MARPAGRGAGVAAARAAAADAPAGGRHLRSVSSLRTIGSDTEENGGHRVNSPQRHGGTEGLCTKNLCVPVPLWLNTSVSSCRLPELPGEAPRIVARRRFA